MKSHNFLPEVARKVTSSTAIMLVIAGSAILSCKKENSSAQNAPQPTSTEHLNKTGNVQNSFSTTGTNNGFYYQCYYTTGTASLTNGSAGNFSVTYNNVGDVVAGKGYNPGSAQAIGYNVGALSGSYNFVGVYGWTTSPLIEYYVCDFGSVVAGTQVNTVSSDGHTYTFYKHQQVSQPSIQGTATFWQYLDNWGGSSTGSNHTITMVNHVNNWVSHGGEGFGAYNYQILALEAYSGKSGYINATVW